MIRPVTKPLTYLALGVLLTLATAALGSFTATFSWPQGVASDGTIRTRGPFRTDYFHHDVSLGSPPPLPDPTLFRATVRSLDYPGHVPGCVLYPRDSLHLYSSIAETGLPLRCFWGLSISDDATRLRSRIHA